VYYLAVLLAEQAWTKQELLNATGGNVFYFILLYLIYFNLILFVVYIMKRSE
jgi:hypothetical protein